MKKIDIPLTLEGKGHKNQNSSRGKMFGYQVLGFGAGDSGPKPFNAAHIFILAGGGAGANMGGGGAGGFRVLSSQEIPGSPVTITVGDGGSATSGSASTVGLKSGTLSSTGGGRSAPGGSGGGGAPPSQGGFAGNAGGFSPSEGNPGGAATQQPGARAAGGGGGGAGGSGGNAGPGGSPGGAGGSGSNVTPFFGASPQPFYGPQNGLYAGGGGGQNQGNSPNGPGPAGPGGGGSGGAGPGGSPGSAGQANTGGGGGGRNNNGGSGRVMILIPSEFAPTVEVSPGTNTLTSTPAGSVATFTVTGTLGRI